LRAGGDPRTLSVVASECMLVDEVKPLGSDEIAGVHAEELRGARMISPRAVVGSGAGRSASLPSGLAAGELFERPDGSPWVRHRIELVLDAPSRASVRVVV
jgi:hypothetical protein